MIFRERKPNLQYRTIFRANKRPVFPANCRRLFLEDRLSKSRIYYPLFENGYFFLCSQKSASTRCVFASFLPVQIKRKRISHWKRYDVSTRHVDFILPPFFFFFSTLASITKRCFQKSPLWRAFLKSCVFGNRFHLTLVDGRKYRRKQISVFK